jgi:hypothetical protein
VGAGAAAVIVLTAAGSSPAFAVTPHRDGTVSVVIRRVEGIPGANRRLAQLGIRARAVRVAEGCQVAPPGALSRIAVATLVRHGHTNWVGGTPGAIKTQIRPAQIPSGRTLVISAVRAGTLVRLARGRAVPGAIPACLPPAVQVRTNARGAVVQMVACRGGVPVRPFCGGTPARPPVFIPGPRTNGTSTNAEPPPSTETQTEITPQPVTGSGTETNSGTATRSGTTASLSPPGSASPTLVRACRFAARAAAR